MSTRREHYSPRSSGQSLLEVTCFEFVLLLYKSGRSDRNDLFKEKLEWSLGTSEDICEARDIFNADRFHLNYLTSK